MVLFRIGAALLGLAACVVGVSALSKLTRPVVDAGRGQVAVLGLFLLLAGGGLLRLSWQTGRRADRRPPP